MDDAAEDSRWIIQSSRIVYNRTLKGRKVLLGKGAFGKVYKGRLSGWPQPVAIKIIDTTGESPQSVQAHLRRASREEQLVRSCDSRYIVGFLGVFTMRQAVGLVFEYMPGGDLYEALGTENVALTGSMEAHTRAIKIAQDVAQGLCYLHSKRIVHLDIKSPNILLDRDYSAKIADVGIARHITHSRLRPSAESGCIGSWNWAAPEILINEDPVTTQADIYSFGVVLWELGSESRPERGRIRSDDVPLFSGLIAACMRKDPEARPTAMQLLQHLHVHQASALHDISHLSSSPLGASSYSSSSSVDHQQPGTMSGPKVAPGSYRGSSSTAAEMMQFDSRIDPARIEVCTRPDGSQWQLGDEIHHKVYKARLDGVDDVAVRFIDSQPHTRDSVRAEFMTEINLLNACRHAGLVSFIGFWEQDAVMLYVMEFVEGGSLLEALTSHEMRDQLAWDHKGKQIALDVARALHYLHGQNVAHLRLSSLNILLTLDYRAKVKDVGLAKLLNKGADAGSDRLLSQYAWQAPETFKQHSLTLAADIYAFGGMLLRLTAQLPDGRCQLPNFREHIASFMRHRLPGHCPAAVLELAHTCIREDPRERPSAKQVVASILECC